MAEARLPYTRGVRLLPNDRDLGWTPYAWLVYLVPFTITPALSPWQNHAAGWLLYGAATVAFLVLYFRSHWAASQRELILLATATTVMALGFWPVSYGAGALFIYASSMLGQWLPPRRATIGVTIVAASVIVEAVVLQRQWFNTAWPFVFTVVIGAINIHFAQVGRANTRLRLAQDEIEHLAKVAERERIARDLHDLLGHTLSLIVLKSELASKLAERDPERARTEIRDVEKIAREALAEVRSAVSGYRSGGLDAEVTHARQTLATAGLEVDCSVTAVSLTPAQEAVLSLALREAVTNIVRHSGARHCRIELGAADGGCRLVIADDGRGGDGSFGTGLTGMRERVEVLGGTMTRDGRKGTTVTIALPAATMAAERSA
jgi:two-component system sensor histidine kinase DesK